MVWFHCSEMRRDDGLTHQNPDPIAKTPPRHLSKIVVCGKILVVKQL